MSSKIILFKKKKTMFFSPSHPRITLLIDPKKQQKNIYSCHRLKSILLIKIKKKKKEITISYRIDYEKRFLKNIRN
jgi:hypothetical protein